MGALRVIKNTIVAGTPICMVTLKNFVRITGMTIIMELPQMVQRGDPVNGLGLAIVSFVEVLGNHRLTSVAQLPGLLILPFVFSPLLNTILIILDFVLFYRYSHLRRLLRELNRLLRTLKILPQATGTP